MITRVRFRFDRFERIQFVTVFQAIYPHPDKRQTDKLNPDSKLWLRKSFILFSLLKLTVCYLSGGGSIT